MKNPALVYFKHNRQQMRKTAEEKFKERVLSKVEQDLEKCAKRYKDACLEID